MMIWWNNICGSCRAWNCGSNESLCVENGVVVVKLLMNEVVKTDLMKQKSEFSLYWNAVLTQWVLWMKKWNLRNLLSVTRAVDCSNQRLNSWCNCGVVVVLAKSHLKTLFFDVKAWYLIKLWIVLFLSCLLPVNNSVFQWFDLDFPFDIANRCKPLRIRWIWLFCI